ncbi:hypothetical protein DPMN_091147 [Dreissena polymorpha]|uniref:Uncharacterized protein n=1 Tax=Dreissena polymorpha TaxID=45954 RepID=A0A9D4KZ22_DREPO|nr:hypothetical protein DPMN_091147 [Dreissena polymorpha]
MPIRPVILHMRDAADQHCGEIGARCLQIMRTNVAPIQRINLHRFTGVVGQVVSWLETFPKCYFGATGLVREFDSFQKAALRRIRKGHLLLDTDALYFRPLQASANIPAVFGEVAMQVSLERENGGRSPGFHLSQCTYPLPDVIPCRRRQTWELNFLTRRCTYFVHVIYLKSLVEGARPS